MFDPRDSESAACPHNLSTLQSARNRPRQSPPGGMFGAMGSERTGDDSELVPAAQQGDAQAMFELGMRAEEQSRQLFAEARQWFERSVQAGSLEALHALVRHVIVEGEAELPVALSLLQQVERKHSDEPPERLVSVSIPDLRGEASFTILTPYPQRAAEAIAPAALRLMDVDENGVEMPEEDRWRRYEQTGELLYTPNYIGDVKWGYCGAFVSLDTKDYISTAMVTTMAEILREALAAHAIPAHITGWTPRSSQDFHQTCPLPEPSD